MIKEIPVFLFGGFLDSGKTTLIKQIIEGEEAYQSYNTLIISTEEGEVEYDSDWIKENEINFVLIEDDEFKDEQYFLDLVKKYNPKQIVIELNPFIDFNEFKLPRSFKIVQEITLFDASKFELYFNNMKPLINRMVQYASLVVFNRCENNLNLNKYRRNIRSFNQDTQIAFENSDGKLTTLLDEDLPYDINSDVIHLKDEDYPIWYLDMSESFRKYQNKQITFKAYIRDVNLNTIVVGRQIMTCCLDDIQFYGFECITDEFVYNNSFVEITCTPIINYSEIALREVLMLQALNIKKLEYVEEEYLSFN